MDIMSLINDGEIVHKIKVRGIEFTFKDLTMEEYDLAMKKEGWINQLKKELFMRLFKSDNTMTEDKIDRLPVRHLLEMRKQMEIVVKEYDKSFLDGQKVKKQS